MQTEIGGIYFADEETKEQTQTISRGNIMFEKRQNLNKNINYAFVIRSSFFHPFDEVNLKLSFIIDHASDTFVGYYHLAIDDTDQDDLSSSDKLKYVKNRNHSAVNSKYFKKIALA